MPTPDDKNKVHALSREWAAARIVVIGGLIVALAVAGYFAYRAREATIAAQQAAAPVMTPKVDAKTVARVELIVCNAELAHAKDLGIIPQYGRLDTPKLVRTQVERRYVCIGVTHLSKYYIAADLRCDNLADARCMSVYRIALPDGTLLYSRPE